MNKLERYQEYANKCAEKLELGTYPILRWSGEPCKVSKSTYAHCHIKDSEFPRGTICLNKHIIAELSVKDWHNTIAHEVTHLAVKSNHSSSTFAKRMVSLGVANKREQLMAKLGKKHKHIFNTVYYENGVRVYATCMICHKKKYYS